MRTLTTVHDPWRKEMMRLFASVKNNDVHFHFALILDYSITFYNKMNVHEVICNSLLFFSFSFSF